MLFAHYLYNPDPTHITSSVQGSAHTDLWVFSPGNAAGNRAAALAANSSAKIGMYSSLLWTKPSTNQAVIDTQAVPWTTADSHEDWFVHKTDTGHSRYGPDSFGNYTLNPNPDFGNGTTGHQTALVNAVVAHMLDAYSRNGPYDFIFMDGVTTTLIQGLGATVEYGTDSTVTYPTSWMQNGMNSYMAAIVAGLHAGGVPFVIANDGINLNYAAWIDTDGVSHHTKDVLAAFDGDMEESWTDGGLGPAQQQGPAWGGTGNNRWWAGKYAGAKYAAAQGKYRMNHSKGASTQQVFRYAFCSHLLTIAGDPAASGGKQMFCINGNTTSSGGSNWYPEYANGLILGAPSGAATFDAVTGVYTRVFANGTVKVNPTSVTQAGIAPWDASLTVTSAASAPANSSAPVISGGSLFGSVLTCAIGTWSGVPSPTFAFQWKRNGASITGATSSSYTIGAIDAGATITCTVTATNSQGTASATSNSVVAATTPATSSRRVQVDQTSNRILASELPAGAVVDVAATPKPVIDSTGATDGQALAWNAASGTWVPVTGAAGGLTSFQGRSAAAAVLTKADVTGTGLGAADVGALASFQGRGAAAAVLTKADVTGTGLAASDIGAVVTADVQVFTAGAGTWTKPTGAKSVQVVCIGGGGGGGSGRRGAAGTVRCGGGGGGGAGRSQRSFSAAVLPGTVAVAAGAAGGGGAAITVDDTNGTGGNNGGASTFGAYLRAAGGSGGGGGTNAAGTAGSSGTGIEAGGAGGAASGTGGVGGASLATAVGPSGGAAGGGITAADVASNGGAGGGSTAADTTIAPGGVVDTTPPAAGNAQPANSGLPGNGGGGGAASKTAAAQAGGAGGLYGAGGAGGGASLDGFASGAGGLAGAGLVVVVSYF